ncbi:SpoIVB peptidase [Eubacteriales bacterium OttesenSCG-928-K08]|nr:SpoIVB peptidase [Eubacteriales bacterium OttesenSCG-928-K08]
MKNRFLRRALQALGVTLCALILALNYSGPILSLRDIPQIIHIPAGESYILPLEQNSLLTASCDTDTLEVSMLSGETLAEATGEDTSGNSNITVSLFGIVPVKSIQVNVRNEIMLAPGGTSIGVTLHTKGALVVGISSILLANGETASPAAAAGLQAGDIIERANGVEIQDSNHLKEICNNSKDGVDLQILRGNDRFSATLKPVLEPQENQYRMGMWVRDSTAGVGTLSFYDPVSKKYAALGHAITDVDTRSPLTVREGEIVQSSIVDIVQGAQGEPGELRGTFNSSSHTLGSIEKNSQYGIYGTMYNTFVNPLYKDGLPMAYPEDVVVGPAEILTTISDEGIKSYSCEIIKTNPQNSPAQKGMVVEITDPELLRATGGIVQGMSGSPLVQNGKLIGVVTHVFINDPKKGYCMYALWMYDQIVN